MKKLFLQLIISSIFLMSSSHLHAMEEEDGNIQDPLLGTSQKFNTLKTGYNLFLKAKVPLQILFYLVTLGYISVNVAYTYLSTSILKSECTSCATQLGDVKSLIDLLSEVGKMGVAALKNCPAGQEDALEAFALLGKFLHTCCNETQT